MYTKKVISNASSESRKVRVSAKSLLIKALSTPATRNSFEPPNSPWYAPGTEYSYVKWPSVHPTTGTVLRTSWRPPACCAHGRHDVHMPHCRLTDLYVVRLEHGHPLVVTI